MKSEKNFIDYGIYVDRKQSFIISLNHNTHEEVIGEENEEIEERAEGSTALHQQNRDNELLKKYCKSIIKRITHAHNILVFGPSVSKFELQKEIRETAELKLVNEELLTTDSMNKEEALRFVKKHYAPATATI
jgi:TPP-dependent 2-oxoacid decarboxylase